MEQEKLATELLHELKQSSRRWFIAFITVLVLWFATIGIFIWYISLPVEEYTDYVAQESNYGERNIQIVGGSNYGETNSEKNLQEESKQNP